MIDDFDEAAFEQQLRTAVEEHDGVPARLKRAAVGAYAWRTIDADLAELEFDSRADLAPEAVRGDGEPRMLTFRAGGLTVEVEIEDHGTRRRLVGRIDPPGPRAVHLQRGAEVTALDADQFGRFTLGDVAPGPLRLRLTPVGAVGAAVVTEWIAA
jgi:hypothetical protein